MSSNTDSTNNRRGNPATRSDIPNTPVRRPQLRRTRAPRPKPLRQRVAEIMAHPHFTTARTFLVQTFKRFRLPMNTILQDVQVENSTMMQKHSFADGNTATVRVSDLDKGTSSGCYMDTYGNMFQFVRIGNDWSVNYSSIVHQMEENQQV